MLSRFRKGYRKKAYRALLSAFPASLGARLHYLDRHRRWPSLGSPQRFSELVLAQMLHGDHEAFATLADKIKVKDYVAQKIDSSWVIPTIWHGPTLPPRRQRDWPIPFVLKGNAGSGRNIFVRDAKDLDWDRIETTSARWVGERWPKWKHEDWYNLMEPQLLVEPLIGDGSGNLPDFKFFVFSGRAHLVQVDTGRFGNHTRALYDRDWVKQSFSFNFRVPTTPGTLPRPASFDRMLQAADALGEGFDFVRVDFYELPDGPRFGEMTFSPAAGMVAFSPDRYELALGQVWRDGVAATRGAKGPPRGRAPALSMAPTAERRISG